MILLQVDSLAIGTSSTPEKETFFDVMVQGGWTMVPLVILLFLAIYLFIERYLSIRRANHDPSIFVSNVRGLVQTGNLEQAKNLCMTENTPFSRMILKGINRLGQPLSDIRTSIENVGSLEINNLEKRLAYLATIAGAAPMLGFFGTVMGMIFAFMEIAKSQGNVSPADLADGIYTAMVTTAGGLFVGIIAYLGYNILVSMVSSVVYKMESTSTEFIDLLQEPVS